MKKVLFTASLITIISCSKDEPRTATTCNCVKTFEIATSEDNFATWTPTTKTPEATGLPCNYNNYTEVISTSGNNGTVTAVERSKIKCY